MHNLAGATQQEGDTFQSMIWKDKYKKKPGSVGGMA
jgi:hypothetical protein